MRITHGMVSDTTLRNIQGNMARMEALQGQLTSGSRIRVPSDDPIGATRAITLEESLEQTGQYLKNIDQATAWLNVTDSVLDSVTQLVHRARDLAVQASSDTLSSNDRLAAGAEIGQLREQLLNLANSKYESRYIFGGTATHQPPYTTPADASFQGNQQPLEREIQQSVTMSISVDGKTTFGALFTTLDELQQRMAADDAPGIAARIGALDSRLDTVLTARSQVGAKTNRLEFARGRLQDIEVNVTTLLSNVKDVDMAEAMTNFSMAEAVYQASLQASSRALQPSLLDYLR